MIHVVGLSGGKDSTAMALRLRILRPDINFIYICTPTGNEPEEMFEHWRKLEQRLESPMHMLGRSADGKSMMEVIGTANYQRSGMMTLERLIEIQNALPNNRQRWCTRMLKIEPTIWWMTANAPLVSYVGLRADEEERQGIYGDVEGVTFKYPMRDEWEWDERDVWKYLAERGQTIPIRTDCEYCYDQRLIDWKRLLKEHPDRYQHGIELEAQTGRTFRSPTHDTWPAGLVQLADAFTSGRKVRGEDKEVSGDQQACRVCRL